MSKGACCQASLPEFKTKAPQGGRRESNPQVVLPLPIYTETTDTNEPTANAQPYTPSTHFYTRDGTVQGFKGPLLTPSTTGETEADSGRAPWRGQPGMPREPIPPLFLAL